MLAIAPHAVQGQEDESLENFSESEGDERFYRHMIQAGLAHNHTSTGIDEDGERRWLALPAYILNYNYRFNEDWSLGLHTDIIVEQFEVEDESDQATFERTNPITVSAMGSYRIWGPIHVLAGGGVEFAKEENLSLMRVGIEPAWEFGKGRWEVGFGLFYELKFTAYNTLNIGLAVARLF